jgi:hypothetical protein
MMRGIELYRGKPIFYGLGHFAFDMPGMESLDPVQIKKWRELGDYVIYPRENYPLLPFHSDTRMTMVGICGFRGRSIEKVGLIPCLINTKNQPVPLSLDSSDGRRVLEYMRSITRDAGLTTRYEREGFFLGESEAAVAR